MKYKTKVLVDRFSRIFSNWPTVECVSLNEAALPDTLDPYFALILDVYYQGTIPQADKRYHEFGNVLAFETTHRGNKDRFLMGDIPVRVEYKSTIMVDELVSIADKNLDRIWLIKDSGTYGYYRFANGEILFSSSEWIQGIRTRLGLLQDEFWGEMRAAAQSKMEHFLSDLGAAFIQGDDFNYLISSSGFIKHACLTLFCLNKCFEPSHRAYYQKVLALPVLPEGFAAQLESFLRHDAEITAERKYKIAQLIARSIVSLE